MMTLNSRREILRVISEDIYREYDIITENMDIHADVAIKDILKRLCRKEYIVDFMIKMKEYDYSTYVHVIRVAVFSILIGYVLGENEKHIIEIGAAGLLHDIGKINIPIEIINKKGKLDEIEFNIIKSHVSRSVYEIKKLYRFESENILRGIYEHHEKVDGTGYPRHINGEEISLEGRILAIADIFEAYSSSRAYHEARTVNQTVEFMETLTGLDKEILNKFICHLNINTGKIKV